MIQRKQTVFLALALISYIVLFLFPYAHLPMGTEINLHIGVFGLLSEDAFKEVFSQSGVNFMFVAMQILITLFMSTVIVVIFSYKKRLLQIRLCALAFLINVFVIGAMFFTVSRVAKTLLIETPANYLLPAYVPMITLLLVMAALRAIRRDEAMIRSLNRLR